MHPGHQPQPPMSAAPANPAQLPSIILIVCGVLILAGLFTKGWASGSEGRDEINVGLLGMEGCGRGACVDVDWGVGARALEIGGLTSALRYLALLGGLGAIGAIGFAAAMGLTRNAHKIPLPLINAAMGVGAFLMTFFAVRLAMSDQDVQLGPSYSVFLAIGGVLAAGLVVQLMLRPVVQAMRPDAPLSVQPQLPYQAPPLPYQAPPPPYQAPPQAAAVGCPRCGQPAQYVAQYQRYYCGACQQYL